MVGARGEIVGLEIRPLLFFVEMEIARSRFSFLYAGWWPMELRKGQRSQSQAGFLFDLRGHRTVTSIIMWNSYSYKPFMDTYISFVLTINHENLVGPLKFS